MGMDEAIARADAAAQARMCTISYSQVAGSSPAVQGSAKHASREQPKAMTTVDPDGWNSDHLAHASELRKEAQTCALEMRKCFEEAAYRYHHHTNKMERGFATIGRVDAGRKWQAKMVSCNRAAMEATLLAHNSYAVVGLLLEWEDTKWSRLGELKVDIH